MSAGGTRRSQKLPQRVQFTSEVETESAANENNVRPNVPQIRLPEGDDLEDASSKIPDWTTRKKISAMSAQDRAMKLQSRLSTPGTLSRSDSTGDYFSSQNIQPNNEPYESPPLRPLADHPGLYNIPLGDVNNARISRPYDINDDTTDDDDDPEVDRSLKQSPAHRDENAEEARRLVRSLTNGMGLLQPRPHESRSGTVTPAIDRQMLTYEIDYVARPDQYKPSLLSSILFSKLGQTPPTEEEGSIQANSSRPRQERPKRLPRNTHKDHQSPENTSGLSSGMVTPSGRKPKWYDKSPRESISSAATLTSGGPSGARTPVINSAKRPVPVRARSSGMIATAVDLIKRPMSSSKTSRTNSLKDHVIDLENQITDILARRKYILKLCRALMIFGAPTHRMEEYMLTTARRLLVQGSFQYLPNCMIIAFDDPDTHTTEVHLIKEAAAIDLGKFEDTFDIYKNVIHEVYTAAEAIQELNEIMGRPKLFPNWLLILIYGLAAISVGPFAFNARPVDFPICFLLGCVLGYLQLEVAPHSTQFSHVFEVLASILTSFAARGFGSILHKGTPVFCFSAIAQSSIALILPGWIILSAAQELQSRNLVAGSIRMVYAIIYTLFLGFGILIGTTLMGLMYSGATNSVTCDIPWWWHAEPRWRAIYINFAFVPVFTICLSMINQARWRQMVPIVVISLAGYTTNYFASIRFAQNIQIANACGAFVIGSLANLYSRFFHGLAAAAMLPAIFVQVPSGLAASGSLVAGLSSANSITSNAGGASVITNGTQGFLDAQNNTSASSSSSDALYGVGYGMVQVAIGISVGLFMSALFIYPFNKRRSGLFSF